MVSTQGEVKGISASGRDEIHQDSHHLRLAGLGKESGPAPRGRAYRRKRPPRLHTAPPCLTLNAERARLANGGRAQCRYGRQADLRPDFLHGDRTGAICADRIVGRRPTLPVDERSRLDGTWLSQGRQELPGLHRVAETLNTSARAASTPEEHLGCLDTRTPGKGTGRLQAA
jgi:hypothetical protein